jgi:hypothetical protein
MFEKYIDYKIAKNYSQLDSKRDIMKFGNIFSVKGVEKYILQYFEAELKWLIYKEKINIQSDIHISADPSEVQLSMFKRSLFGKLMINKSDLKERVAFAVKIHFNFMLRPLFTIEKFIFENSFSKPAEEIERKMEYLRGYQNLHDVARNFLDCVVKDADTNIISAENFMSVIKDADKSFFYDVDAFDLFDYMEPMFRCFEQEDGRIEMPFEAFLLYFDDKNNRELYSYLLDLKSEKGLGLLDEDDIQIVLNDLVLFIEERNAGNPQEFDDDDIEKCGSKESADVENQIEIEEISEFEKGAEAIEEELLHSDVEEPQPEPVFEEESGINEEIEETSQEDFIEEPKEDEVETAGPDPIESFEEEVLPENSAEQDESGNIEEAVAEAEEVIQDEEPEEEIEDEIEDDGFDDLFDDMEPEEENPEDNEEVTAGEAPEDTPEEEIPEVKDDKDDSDMSDDDLLALAEQILNER